MPDELDTSSRYQVAGYNGIAFALLGYETYRDEDYEWTGIESTNEERVRIVMIGDDYVYTVDIEDITAIDDDEYCPECGQIGCKAYG